MSIDGLRRDIAGLIKSQSDQEARMATARAEIARLQDDAARLQRDAARASSISSATSALQKAARKLKDASDKEKRLAEASKKCADIAGRRARLERQLASELAQEQRKQHDSQKRMHAEQIRSAREVTAELERQAHLHRTMAATTRLLPERIKVLFLGANPADTTRLRLDVEVRTITEKLRMSEFRESVELVSRWAVRTTDVLQHLNEHRPRIVHFSGHGGSDGSLCFELPDGSTKAVSVDAIAAVLSTVGDDVQLVVFNACFSADQAEAATRHVSAAVGMADSLDDAAASLFAGHFYSAIAFGHSIRVAFEQARAALLLDDHADAQIVRLFLREESAGEASLVSAGKIADSTM